MKNKIKYYLRAVFYWNFKSFSYIRLSNRRNSVSAYIHDRNKFPLFHKTAVLVTLIVYTVKIYLFILSFIYHVDVRYQNILYSKMVPFYYYIAIPINYFYQFGFFYFCGVSNFEIFQQGHSENTSRNYYSKSTRIRNMHIRVFRF